VVQQVTKVVTMVLTIQAHFDRIRSPLT